MDGQRRETPAMPIGNRNTSQPSEQVIAGQRDRQKGSRRGQPEILRRPPEDQGEDRIGPNQTLRVEPEGQVEQFGGKEGDRADDGGPNRLSDTPPPRGQIARLQRVTEGRNLRSDEVPVAIHVPGRSR